MRNFDRYSNIIESMVRRYPSQHWRDLRQECALKFFEVRENYRDKPDGEFFLIAVRAMNFGLIDYMGKEYVEDHLSLDAVAYEDDFTGYSINFADLLEEPSILIEEIEARDYIDKMKIPEEDLKVLRLYYVEGYTTREISELGFVDGSHMRVHRIISRYS